MAFGPTQALVDALAAYEADTLFSGSTNVIEIINAADSVIASASDVSVNDTANVLSFTSPGGASVSSTDTAAGFRIKDAGGTNTYYEFKNTSYTITPANQDDTGDTFTSTSHGLTLGQPLVISGGIPTTSPAVSDGDTVFVVEVTTDTFKIERLPKAGAVDITAVAGTDTTFTAPTAVGGASSGALMELTSGTSLTSGETVLVSTFTIENPTYGVGAGA